MKRGIIGRAGDPQVRSVATRVRALGHEPVLLDLSAFPARTRLGLRDGVPQAGGIDLDDVPYWYVRSLPLPLPFLARTNPASDGDGRRAYAAGRERRSFLAGFVAAMQASGATLVNPPQVMAQHFRKLEQLDTLRAAGVAVPATLATNDPEAVREFVRDVGGSVIYKPVAGGGQCRRLVEADLRPERLARLAGAPVLFQAEVPGRNIRVYVVGGRIVAAYEIVASRLDYRGAETAVVPATLSAAEHDACRRSAQACGMAFTGIDLRRRPDDGFAVLECNPSPMFAAIERRTGDDPVSRALAAMLSGEQAPAEMFTAAALSVGR